MHCDPRVFRSTPSNHQPRRHESCSEEKDIVAFVATFALACGLSFSGAAVQAKSACKGLKRNPCEVKGVVVIFEVISSQQSAIIRYYIGV